MDLTRTPVTSPGLTEIVTGARTEWLQWADDAGVEMTLIGQGTANSNVGLFVAIGLNGTTSSTGINADVPSANVRIALMASYFANSNAEGYSFATPMAAVGAGTGTVTVRLNGTIVG